MRKNVFFTLLKKEKKKKNKMPQKAPPKTTCPLGKKQRAFVVFPFLKLGLQRNKPKKSELPLGRASPFFSKMQKKIEIVFLFLILLGEKTKT